MGDRKWLDPDGRGRGQKLGEREKEEDITKIVRNIREHHGCLSPL